MGEMHIDLYLLLPLPLSALALARSDGVMVILDVTLAFQRLSAGTTKAIF